MDEIALKAYRMKLSEKEESYKMHKNSYDYNILKYRNHIIVYIGLMFLNDIFCLHLFVDAIPDAILIMIWCTNGIFLIALIKNVIDYYRYTHMRQAIKIGPFTISGRNNLLAILKEDERQISTLKNQIAFIERERELQAKESNK